MVLNVLLGHGGKSFYTHGKLGFGADSTHITNEVSNLHERLDSARLVPFSPSPP